MTRRLLLLLLSLRIGDSSYEEIQDQLSALPDGAVVRLTVLREGREVELTAVK